MAKPFDVIKICSLNKEFSKRYVDKYSFLNWGNYMRVFNFMIDYIKSTSLLGRGVQNGNC